MTPTPENNENLERLIHRTLRELPPRPAPRTLERRVMAELERRAALPWWRKSFVHWPLGVRAIFVLLCAAIIRGALMLGGVVMPNADAGGIKAAIVQHFGWMENGLAVIHAITGFFDIMLRNIPPLWLYGGLAFVATMYLALFGLGAAAYKALRTHS
jgi:hypothetical protein